MKLILTAIAVVFFISTEAKAQQKLTIAQQQEDFRIFKTSMQEMHAGVYWFISLQRFNALFDSVNATIKDNEDAEQFYMKIRFCMAALHHGHDGVEWTNRQSGPNYKMNAIPANRKHLPFVMEYLGDRLYILNNCSSNKKITNGSEIVSINGKTIKSLNKQMLQYVFANGRNTTYKYKMLGFYFQFHYLYQMLYPIETSYKLSILPYKSTKKIEVQANAELAKLLPTGISSKQTNQSTIGIHYSNTKYWIKKKALAIVRWKHFLPSASIPTVLNWQRCWKKCLHK